MTEYMELALLSVLVFVALLLGAAYAAYKGMETRDVPNRIAWFMMSVMADAVAVLLLTLHVHANTTLDLSGFAYFGLVLLIAIGTLWMGYMAYALRHKGTDFS